MYGLLYLKEHSPSSYVYQDNTVVDLVDPYTPHSPPGVLDCAALEGQSALHFSHYSVDEATRRGHTRAWGFAPDQTDAAVQWRYQIVRHVLDQWQAHCAGRSSPPEASSSSPISSP